MHRHSRLALVLSLLACSIGAQQITHDRAPGDGEHGGLRVLLVGHDPAAPQVPFTDMAKERTYRLYRERTAAFEALLRYHFADVRVVYAGDYSPEMSDDVDVTVFDARPKQRAADGEADGDGASSSYRPPSYLPASFDRPALMIAETSPLIGEPLGLKLDWL